MFKVIAMSAKEKTPMEQAKANFDMYSLLTQELLHYQTEPMPPEPPLSPVPSPSENRK